MIKRPTFGGKRSAFSPSRFTGIVRCNNVIGVTRVGVLIKSIASVLRSITSRGEILTAPVKSVRHRSRSIVIKDVGINRNCRKIGRLGSTLGSHFTVLQLPCASSFGRLVRGGANLSSSCTLVFLRGIGGTVDGLVSRRSRKRTTSALHNCVSTTRCFYSCKMAGSAGARMVRSCVVGGVRSLSRCVSTESVVQART